MQRLLILCIVLGSCILLQDAGALETSVHGAIVPGESVAGVNLGSSLSDFQTVFPNNPRNEEKGYDSVCAGTYYQWFDADLVATGLFVYIKDNKIYQISVQTPRFSTQNGIKMDSSESSVMRNFPNGQLYVLLHSGNESVGGRDLEYWVDSKDGIAFEFYWNRLRKMRLVGAIDIFSTASSYRPEGCISPPRQWQLLK